jgi:hypothetical protein
MQMKPINLLFLLVLRLGCGFQVSRLQPAHRRNNLSRVTPTTNTWRLHFSSDNDDKPEYSREIQLREEVESPFSKVRFFVYVTLGLGALTSLAISMARVAAALSGVNTDLLQESATNAAVDIGGLALIGFLLKQDLDAKDSRLKRASKGATLAALKIHANRRLLGDDNDSFFTTTLSSLRSGRGIEKRVVIAVAGKEKMKKILQDASKLENSLSFNDLVVVPVVYPQAIAPEVDGDYKIPESVAFPAGEGWKAVIDDETSEARNQGVTVESDGISIILKKNGRVGQRTKGVYLGNMVGEVEARRESGMDVSNI